MDTDQNISDKPAMQYDFERLTEGLRNAVTQFQNDQSPENFAGIITALTGFGISGADMWKRAADYAKVHPVHVALGAGLLFYAMKGLLGDSSRRRDSSYH